MRNLKKVIALVAVFAMIISSVAFAATFSDVADTDNYAEAIETLSALGILTGDDEDNDGKMDFRPGDTITRAEVTAIISRIQAMGNVSQTATEFNDVPSSHWASGYVSQAAGQGIVNGYGDGNFGPDDTVKYEEIIKMLMETLGYNPYVSENGGYPTGYITAAQRYKVLNDVVGGGIGTEANRGMVAQMVYNAVDTPLMDKYTYGKDAQYVIYDNIDTYGYETLLTRDLKMIKVTGKIVANSYTDMSGANGTTTVDTSMERQLRVSVDNTTSNYNYGLDDFIGTSSRLLTMYQGDVDADDYLGYAVAMYARESNVNDEYTLVSITPNSSRNTTVTFNLDQFSDYVPDNKGTLKYLKNESDRNETRLNLQGSDTRVIYNGVAGDDLAKYFKKGFIEEDSNYSGKITVMDTDDTSGYDVVRIELGVSAVVKDVTTNNSRVRFLKNPYFPNTTSGKSLSYLAFDEDDSTRLAKLTKDGQPYDFTDLKEWDVLTIVWNGIDEVYNARLLGEENSVVGAITSEKALSNGGKEYTLTDGNKYKVAANAYASSLSPGTTGKFYIDEYGKIVAHDKNVEVEGDYTVSKGNYAYVLNAAAEPDAWSQESIRVQLLDKSGVVHEAYLTNSLSVTVGSERKTVKLDETIKLTGESDMTAKQFADYLSNKMITYSANSSGSVRAIVLPSDVNPEDDLYQYAKLEPAYFDEDNMMMSNVEIDEDTYVFYIKGDSDDVKYGQASPKANKDRSSVGKGSGLAEGTYKMVYAFDPDDSSDIPGAIVVMNEDGKISPNTNAAVIDGIGSTSVDGDDAYIVSYYMNGELQTANTKADMDQSDLNGLEDAKRGDVFKLALEGNTITSAKALLVFDRTIKVGESTTTISRPFAQDEHGNNVKATVATGSESTSINSENYVFGAAISISSGGSVTLAKYDKANSSFKLTDTQIVKEATNTNVYLYDSELREENALALGSLNDILEPDAKMVTDGDYVVTGTELDGKVQTPAFGLLDYVFVRTYNRKASDIVVYRNYDFGYYDIDPK